jgi:hypothetical protein
LREDTEAKEGDIQPDRLGVRENNIGNGGKHQKRSKNKNTKTKL